MGDAQDFLNESSGESFPAIKFKKVGDTARGKLISEPHTVVRKSLNDGSDEKQLPINLDCDLVPDGETGPRTLWVRKGFLAAAINDATKEAGTGLAEGGTLAVRFTEERDTGKPQPAKVFAAKYEAPVSAGVSMDDVF